MVLGVVELGCYLGEGRAGTGSASPKQRRERRDEVLQHRELAQIQAVLPEGGRLQSGRVEVAKEMREEPVLCEVGMARVLIKVKSELLCEHTP